MIGTSYIFLFQFSIFFLLHEFVYRVKPHALYKRKSKIYASYMLLFLIFAALIQTEVTDVMLGSAAGWHLRHKIDFYFVDQDHTQYPYFPFMIFFQAIFNWLHETFPIFTFSFYQKILLLISLLYISFFIKNHSTEKGDSFESFRNQLLFLTSPIVYSAVLFHGQTDILVISLLLPALVLLVRPKTTYFLVGSFLFIISIAIKTWSTMFIPLLYALFNKWWKFPLFLSILVLFLLTDVFVYTRIVEGSRILSVLPAVFKAGGPEGIWGIGWILRMIGVSHYSMVLFIPLFAIFVFFLSFRKKPFWDLCLSIIFAFYLLTPKWGIQYLLWMIPFIYLKRLENDKSWYIFLLLTSLYMGITYFSLSSNQSAYEMSQWVGFVVWMYIGYLFFKMLQSGKIQIKQHVKAIKFS